jgi:hypothetical protein
MAMDPKQSRSILLWPIMILSAMSLILVPPSPVVQKALALTIAAKMIIVGSFPAAAVHRRQRARQEISGAQELLI